VRAILACWRAACYSPNLAVRQINRLASALTALGYLGLFVLAVWAKHRSAGFYALLFLVAVAKTLPSDARGAAVPNALRYQHQRQHRSRSEDARQGEGPC
jgi:hypothetical protein